MLIRAIEPKAGIAIMGERRGMSDIRRSCAEPGRLTRALGIDFGLNGAALDRTPFVLEEPAVVQIVEGCRIGITLGAGTLWRFGLAGSPYLSRAFPAKENPVASA